MSRAETRQVVLRQTRDRDGSRHLGACLEPGGDLLMEGQDLGDGVEAHFGAGCREYEWCWTVRAADLPALLDALEQPPGTDPLVALAGRFSGERAAGLKAFLEQHEIPHETWSRVGD